MTQFQGAMQHFRETSTKAERAKAHAEGCPLPSRGAQRSAVHAGPLDSQLGKVNVVFCELNKSHWSGHAFLWAALGRADR